MFFTPATRGLVALDPGDLIACEIVPGPCTCWASLNPTSRQKFAKTYAIILHLEGQAPVQDRMSWFGAGSGRDFFAAYKLCCTWFAAVDDDSFRDFHAGAFAVSATWKTLPIAPHVPTHAFAKQRVQGNPGQWLGVDYILTDFVGPSMKCWLTSVNHQWAGESPDMLRESCLSLLVLCHHSHQSELTWYEKLFCEEICYDVVKRRWFWVVAETLETSRPKISFELACHKAARLLIRDLQRRVSCKADAHGVFVQWEKWSSYSFGQHTKIFH